MPKPNTRSKYFRIGHVDIHVISTERSLLEMIGSWMKDFEFSNGKEMEEPIVFTLIDCVTDHSLPFHVPKHAKLTFENNTARYFAYKNLWIVDFNQIGIMIINRSSNKITGFVHHQYLLESLSRFEDFMHPLSELLRQKKLYPHHAASVGKLGHGLLLLGKSGQGKTTLTVDLINNGFDFLSDDRCFLREIDDRIEMIGFYEPFKIFASNVTHISTLNNLQGLSTTTGNKKSLDIHHYYPEKKQMKSHLRGILFPSWFPGEMSRLEMVPPGKALMDLLPLTMFCFDQASSKTHFEFAGRLVNQIPSARLIMGSDRENWSKLVSEWILQTRGH
jgi:hypothetical protein